MLVINANHKMAGFFNLASSCMVKGSRSPRIFLAQNTAWHYLIR